MPRGRRIRRPDEILQEILVRLPAKSVLRCGAVCRSWRRLASDPAFLAAHHRRQPPLHLIGSFRPAGNLLHPSCLDAVDLRGRERRPAFKPAGYCLVHASCDGLLIVGDEICNPATRQRVSLGKKAMAYCLEIMGLFRHQPSGEYRMLFWRPGDSTLPNPNAQAYHYLTDVAGGKELIEAPGIRVIGAPVVLHGSLHLHWKKHLRNGGYHKILVFDTVAESFRQMPPPAVNPLRVMQLFDMNGTLAASCSKHTMMEMRIFALQDYQSEVWSFQYRIKLPAMEIRRFQEQGDWLARIVSEEGDVLVSCFGWLLHCDRNGNLLAKFQYNDDLPMLIPHRFKESLVRHKFFENKRKDLFSPSYQMLNVPGW
ncbi:hypothetical protein ACP4OV_030446 [Aristida adscensionis]